MLLLSLHQLNRTTISENPDMFATDISIAALNSIFSMNTSLSFRTSRSNLAALQQPTVPFFRVSAVRCQIAFAVLREALCAQRRNKRHLTVPWLCGSKDAALSNVRVSDSERLDCIVMFSQSPMPFNTAFNVLPRSRQLHQPVTRHCRYCRDLDRSPSFGKTSNDEARLSRNIKLSPHRHDHLIPENRTKPPAEPAR